MYEGYSLIYSCKSYNRCIATILHNKTHVLCKGFHWNVPVSLHGAV